MHETFWSLLHDSAHWEFELFLMVLVDGVIGALIWPFVKRHFRRDAELARKQAQHADCVHNPE